MSDLLMDLIDEQDVEAMSDAELLVAYRQIKYELDHPESHWSDDPIGYSENILGADRPAGSPPYWWAKQREIAEKLNTPPHRVLVRACHSVGKSFAVASLINWFFDSHNPGIVLTTSPKYDQVKDVLWKEIRRQRRGRVDVFPGPKAPRMETSESHYATGFTANVGAAAQGQHEEYVLGVIDEAVSVDKQIWEAFDSMCTHFLAICNPTDPGSEFYRREQVGGWHSIQIECFEHPNIIAELQGLPPPYPSAIRLNWLRQRIITDKWATPVIGPPQPGDFEFEGVWYHPGPLAECRLLGRWPSAAGNVWSEQLFVSCERRPALPFPMDRTPEIGCDVARFGDDETAFHCRWGAVSLKHESVNGWSTAQTAGRLKQLAAEMADFCNSKRERGLQPVHPEEIPIKIDDDGVGGGVTDQADGFRFIPIRNGSTAYDPERYPNRRSELWFDVQERAQAGLLCLSLLPADVRLKLRLEALAPSYKLDGAGRRVVEPKDITKGRLQRSPDNMDAVNLAYCESGGDVAHWIGPSTSTPTAQTEGSRQGLFGRPTPTNAMDERRRVTRILGR